MEVRREEADVWPWCSPRLGGHVGRIIWGALDMVDMVISLRGHE